MKTISRFWRSVRPADRKAMKNRLLEDLRAIDETYRIQNDFAAWTAELDDTAPEPSIGSEGRL